MQFLQYNYKIMKIGCLLPLEKDANICNKIFFYFFRILNLILISWTLIITLFYYVYIDSSFDQFLLLINDMVFIGTMIRLSLYYTYDKTTLNIISFINDKFKYYSNTGLDEININWYIYAVNLSSLIWGASAFCAANLFQAFPIFIGKKPMALWYPYNSSISPYFELSHIFQFLAQNSMWYNYNILDIFYICVVITVAGQFTILTWEIENVCFTTLYLCGFERETILKFRKALFISAEISSEDEFLEIYQFMLTKEYVKQFGITTRNILRYHKDILELCDNLENFLSKSLLLMFLSILSHCVLILYGTSLSTSLIHRLQMAVYFFSAIVESFLIAFPSDFLVQQSNKMQFALYSTPWYLCAKELNSTFKFWHFCLNQKFGLTVGKFTVFDLNAYSWVMKTSFSYFTVLRQTNSST